VYRPVLSPDGKRAALVVLGSNNQPQIWIKQLDRGPVTRLADEGSWPSWTPDGKEVVFRSFRDLMRGPADGSRLPAAFRSSLTRGGAELSPDGKWIIATQLGDVVATRLDGDTTVVPLAVDPRAIEQRGTVSPDGRFVAYQSDASGVPDVYVRPFPDAGSARWSVSVGGGLWPRWSPTGRELFFVDVEQNLYAVPVTLSPTFSAGTPRVLIPSSKLGSILTPFEVSRDGSRFLMARRTGEGSQERSDLVLIQNFREELKVAARR
jgi:serine/threonine-protein kinase